MNEEDRSKAEAGNSSKRGYASPTLVTYGNAKDMIKSGSGAKTEGGKKEADRKPA